MSSALGRKKKRSKWGADLEAEPSATGVSLEGEALDAARIPADSQAARPDPLSTNWRTAELHSDALPNTLQSPRRGSLPADQVSGYRQPGEVTAGLEKHDTGWGAANANGEEQAVNLPKQGFSLNFVRPASKSKVSLANAPPPLATPVEVPSEPTRTTPADSQQGQVSSEARAEPLGKMETVVPSTLPLEGRIASSLLIRDEQSEGRPLPAQPATAPDNKSDAILAEVEVPKAGQHFEAGSEVNAAFVDVKDEQQSPADEEEEGPPGDDGPPGEGPDENDEPAGAGIEDPADPQIERTENGAAQEIATPDGTATEPGLKSQTSRGLPKEPCSLVVSNIRLTANEQSLRLLFESAGEVLGCKLVKDEGTAAHKGFGFVMMASIAEAESAARKFTNFEWGDLRLQVTVKLPAKAASPSPATAAAAVPLPWGVPNGGLPGPPPGISHALSPGPAAETSLPGPPKEQEASTDAALGLSSLPEGSLPPTAPLGMPSSLPIASAYGAYPPYDPYAGYYGYGYGYADPYAAYGAPAYGMPNGLPEPLPSSEIERPPGMEDDELPPGEDSVPAESSPAYQDLSEPGIPGGAAAAEPAQDGQELAEEAVAPPPPPVAPKKEPTVIHVPLKIPEGARKKQEERKKAREEKAKQLAEDGKSAEAANGDAGEPALAVKAAPVVVGTKGSFQEVLARRQAELAALKNKAAAGTSRGAPASRPFQRGRSMSRSPPPASRRSRSARSPYRASPRRPYARSPSRSYSRSPARSYTPSLSRSRSPFNSRRDISYSRSPSRYSLSGSEGRPSMSPGLVKKKYKARKKEKKKKEKKEKKQKSRTREAASARPVPTEHRAVRDSYLLPPKPLDDRPAPGWVAVDAQQPKREIRLPSPPVAEEPRRPAEAAVFRQPARKRARTRWHEEEAGDWQNGEGEAADHEGRPAALGGKREEGQMPERRQEADAKHSQRESGPAVEKRKPSPQVSEEGEIALEDGEIEGELLEVESEQPPAELEPRNHRKAGYEDFRHDDRQRGWNQPRFPPGRGRGRGGRGSWGYGHDNRYVAEPRPW